MELRKSIQKYAKDVLILQYTKGVLKRFYWFIPAFLLDPFDIIERWFGIEVETSVWLGWVLLFIGYSIASFLTYRELRKDKMISDNRVKKLIDAKPSISVFCETYYGNLSIVNDGNMADFRAKAQRIEEGEPIGDEWFVKWKDSLKIDQTIYKGDSHTLEVASCEWIYGMKEGIQAKIPFFRFYKVPQSAIDVDTGKLIIQHHDLSKRFTVVEIEIRIFSQPNLHSPFRRRYLIKLIKDEDTVSIEEIPNGSKW